MPPTKPIVPMQTEVSEFSLRHALTRAQTRMHGHAWTVGPYARSMMRLPSIGVQPFDGMLRDPQRGWVPIVGQMHRHKETTRHLVIVIHGIASCPKEGYVRHLARVLFKDGVDVLCLALRGATGAGSDHYHAGQTAELEALFTDPRLAHYRKISIVGYSLGGQVAVRFAHRVRPPRLNRVIAICSPLCMHASQKVLDRLEMKPYRIAILSILKRKYETLSRNALRMGLPMAADLKSVNGVRTFYDWDATVVCPRYGFDSVERYYQTVSTAPILSQLETPTLLVFTEHDPFIPYPALQSALSQRSGFVELKVSRFGGHVGFPKDTDFGFGPKPGLERQLSHWLRIPVIQGVSAQY